MHRVDIHIHLVLIQAVLVFLVLPHTLKPSILSVEVVQIVVRIELPQRLVGAVWDVVSQEEVDRVLLSAVREGVAVVPANGRKQLTVLVHRPHLQCGGGRVKLASKVKRYTCAVALLSGLTVQI